MRVSLRFFIGLSVLVNASAAWGQEHGQLVGTVVERVSGHAIIGATVYVPALGRGTATEIDGSFTLSLPAGRHAVELSYVGFATNRYEVYIESGKTTQLYATLDDEAQELDLGVVVTAEARHHSVLALLNLQRRSPLVLNGISSVEMERTGDGNAAEAARRITGVNIEKGKYLYVRGLGDRFTKVTLGGAEVPGLDPNRNALQLDLFPSGLLDNIVVYKTAAPNLPGDFAGGYVDIGLRAYPSERTFGVSASVGYRHGTTFNDAFLTYPGGKTDWLGIDDGTRRVPSMVEQIGSPFPEYSLALNSPAEAQRLAKATRAFANNWRFIRQAPTVDHSFGLAFGNQKLFLGKPLGYGVALSYQRSHHFYEHGTYGIYELTGQVASTDDLTAQLQLDDTHGKTEILWGALATFNFKLSPTNRIGFTAMHNQSGEMSARYLEGRKFRDEAEDVFQTRTWDWLQRSLSVGQLTGKHLLSQNAKLELDWNSTLTRSTQDNPDLRFFTNRYLPDLDSYKLKPSSDTPPTRFYRNLLQYTWSNKVDLTLPFRQWTGLSTKLQVGLSYVDVRRDFRETRYNFNNQSLALPGGDVFLYFSENNLIQANDQGLSNSYGVYVVDNYNPRNNYDAAQQVAAGYALIDLPITERLRILTGARLELATARLRTFDTLTTLLKFPQLDGKQNLLEDLDVLPSASINYQLNDIAKLRLAYSRTLARPTFRELAPFASFAVDGGFVMVGNPALQRTLIDNLDLRWEAFGDDGEMVSISAFYKHFLNPIERAFNPKAQNTELSFRNVEQAYLLGAELEFRKRLGFLHPALGAFTLASNFALVHSRTTIDEEELLLIRADDPQASKRRTMYGQAPYSANLMLQFDKERLRATAAFNVSGPRIVTVTKGASPNYYQAPQPTLDMNVSYLFDSGLGLKIAVGNLLDAPYEETATYKGKTYRVAYWETGRTYSLGMSYKLPAGRR